MEQVKGSSIHANEHTHTSLSLLAGKVGVLEKLEELIEE